MGGVPQATSLLSGFKDALNDFLLVELDLQGGDYTWEKSRGTLEWVKERLDRAFATRDWLLAFPLCKLQVVPVPVSDHDHLLLDLYSVVFSKKQFRFRFENTWLQEPSFRQETNEFWSALPPTNIIPKLLSVSSFMAKWGRNVFHKFCDKIRRQKELLESLVNRVDNAGVEAYFEEKERLNELLLHEEIYWKQMAKTFWLTEGDANTKFFHAAASTRRKTNHISSLVTDDGTRVKEGYAMCKAVRDYFIQIFGDSHSQMDAQVVEGTRCVTDDHNRMLTEELSFAEFTIAVKQMHPDKASGPDGLNPAFFQQFWNILGKEVFVCCREWLRNNSFPANFNDTNIVLIPKKEDACCMGDLRPIALCNVLYKILSKVLANRLKRILPHIISENQAAFVPHRSINDNVLITFELIHHMKKAVGGGEGDAALKLDISKTYDRVDWNYLRRRMQVMGFCDQWIKWMLMCVNTVSYDVCFNGGTIGPIIPSRGIRQGDPLSPYLFLFCVEGLSISLTNVVDREDIYGVKVTRTSPVISHLLFADYSFLFFRANQVEAETVKRILDDMYLGLPSLVGRSKKRVFGFVKDRLWKRLQGWKAKKNSRAGKSVLIKNVATVVPSYCMSSFLLPETMCKEMEVMMNKYWWQSGSADRKGIHWVGWDGMKNAREWDTRKVTEIFSNVDADLILATRIPASSVDDRLAWTRTTNGKYSVKTGYQLWHGRNVGTGLSVDVGVDESIPSWLLARLSSMDMAQISTVVKVLWGIWFFRNKKLNQLHKSSSQYSIRWKKQDVGSFKLNVDATFRVGVSSFSVGLVIRDHDGAFVAAKSLSYPMVSTVLEAEAVAIHAGLSWLSSLHYTSIFIESDSLVNVRALQCSHENLLEVGHVLEACRSILDSFPGFSISFVKRQANKVVHLVASLPYSLNCYVSFRSVVGS
ncbi:hypothetical protein AgCh_009018 [Apium graveolens]